MAHKRESMEDPDLICRVMSSASGKITNESSSPSEHTSSAEKTSSNSGHNKREDKNYEMSHEDHLRILSNFSGSEDPYALLRELHILPYVNMGSSGMDPGLDHLGGSSRKQSFSDMIQCLEGRLGVENANEAKVAKDRNWKEDHYFHIDEKDCHTESKCSSFNHLAFFLVRRLQKDISSDTLQIQNPIFSLNLHLYLLIF